MSQGDDDRRSIPGATATPQAIPSGPSWRWSTAFRAVSGFAPGTLVAGRFRIVRFIASGGAGEVYEAEDLELKERVALKTMRPEIADEEPVMERFRREIQLARRVTHPSVCRSFDVFRHRLSPPPGWEGPTPEVTFLSMELLEGETLAERIRGKGPLPTEAALPIVQQVASALAAAHDAGVVHRDLKSSNVILVASKKADKGVRAVVTDFGLARGGGTGSGRESSGTDTGLLAGTPAYMAPEQVEGGSVTPATDVYSLGVVMYEMVTGRWPFEGDTPLAVAIKRLNEKSPSPRALTPNLDPLWEAAILRCLERDPADRFESTQDLVKALAGEEIAPGPAQKRRTRQRTALAVAASALVLIMGGLWLARRPEPSAAPEPSGSEAGTAPRRAVAVLGFKNLSGREEAAWLTKALSEMLTMELAAGGKLRTIPGENVARMKLEMSLPEADSLAPDTLGRIRKSLGTDLVVVGSYFAAGKDSGGKLRLDLRVQDVGTGETAASVSATGTEPEMLELVSRVGAQLRQKLGVAAPATGEVRVSLPSTPEAVRFYSEGLAKLRLFDTLAARDLLTKAAAADPKYPLSHSALAEAWSALGYDAKAKEEARKAFDLSPALAREERLWVEGRYHEAAWAWEKAVATYRTLFGFFPDNLDYGLRLAQAQASFGKGREALVTVEALRKLRPPVSEDPRIDLVEAEAAEALGDFKRVRAVAAQAAQKGAAQGAPLLVARARLLEGYALRALGQPAEAAAANDQAKRIYADAGDRAGVARALLETATLLRYQGDLAKARTTAEEALATSSDVGDQGSRAWALNRIASVHAEQGRLVEARRIYEETIATWREIGGKSGEGTTLNNLGETLRKQGDLAAASAKLEQALALFRGLGHRRGVSFAAYSLGFVLEDQGDLAGARRLLEESLEVSRATGEKSLAAMALFGLGNALMEGGDLAGARARHEEALAIRRQLGEKGRAAESLLALAALSIEEGRSADAEAPAREALAEFKQEKAPQNEANAYTVLAVSLVVQDKLDEARMAIAAATSLAEKSEHRAVRLRVALADARVRGALGSQAEAVKILRSVLAEAAKLGLLGLQLEARLTLGEIEARFGESTSGWRTLATLEREAKEKGFGLVSGKARRAREAAR